MGISNGNCITSGVGPHCSHAEKGDGEKYDCLIKERYRCLGVLNRCLANAMMDTQVSFFDYTGPKHDKEYEATLNQYQQDQYQHMLWLFEGDPTLNSWGFYYDDGQIGLLKYARQRTNALVSCFNSAQCNWSKCYCRETTCPGPCLGMTGAGGGKTDPTKETVTPPGTDPSSGPVPSNTLAVTNSQYALPIPIIYGRQMVAGNIIRLGELVNNVTYTISGATSTPVVRATVDITLGLCEGPIEDIGRIWYDDALVYDNRANINGGILMDADTFGVDTAAPSTTRLTRTQIVLYKGDEDQIPDSDGIAYRGLAYLVVKNFNLTSAKSIPQFRVEIFTRADRSVPVYREVNLPNPVGGGTTHLSGLNPLFADADFDNGVMLLGANGSPENHSRTGVRVVDLDAMAETAQIDPEFTIQLSDDIVLSESFVAADNKALLFAKGTFGSLSVIDVAQFTVVGSTTGAPTITGGYAANVASAATDKVDKLIVALSDSDVHMWWMAAGGGAPTGHTAFSNVFDGKPNRIVRIDRILEPQSGRPTFVNELYYAAVSEASQPVIKLYATVLLRTSSVTSFSHTAPAYVASIPASVWGGATTGVSIVDLHALPHDGALLILISVAGQAYAIKYALSGVVLWVTPVPSLPSYRSTFALYNGFGWKFIGADGIGYTMDFTVGTVRSEFAIDTVPTGPQFYNPADGSITCAINNGNATLRKNFIGRAAAQPQALSAVCSDLFRRAGVLYSNTTDVTDLMIDGYIINTDGAVRAAVAQIKTYYPVEFAEIGGALTVSKRAAGTPIFLSSDTFSAATDDKAAVEVTDTDRVTQLEYLTIGYQRSDQSYALAHASMRKPVFMLNEDFLQDTATEIHEFPFVLSEAHATAICERLLLENDARQNTATITVGTHNIALTPGNVIEVAFDGLSFVGVIQTVLEEPNHRQQLTLYRVDPSVYEDDASLSPITDGTIDYPDIPISKVTGREIIVLPVPLPKGSTYDNILGSINPMVVTVRPSNKSFNAVDGYVDFGGAKTKFGSFTSPPNIGTLRRRPDVRSTVFTLDSSSDLVIFFKDIPTFASATEEELYADPRRNLLIVGQEYIQFCNFSVDPDGKTCHFTNLLRGLYGTDYACHRHALNELCLPWDDAAIQVINHGTKEYTDAYVPVALVEPTDSIYVWNRVAITYYGGKSWASAVCERYEGAIGPVFQVNSRSIIDYDLASQYNSGIDALVHTYGFPPDAVVAVLLQPFEESLLRQALDGKLPNYAMVGFSNNPGGGAVQLGNGIRTQADSTQPYDTTDSAAYINRLDIPAGAIDPTLDACDVAVLFGNHFKTRAGGALDTNKTYGFYVVFRFEASARKGYPYAVGAL